MQDSGERQAFTAGGAMREPATNKGDMSLLSPFALMRLSIWAEKGAAKYAARNWEKGMPLSRYYSATMRHLMKYQMGMDDEDHLAAAMWNIHCLIHHEEMGEFPQLNDMPQYVKEKITVEGDPLAGTGWLLEEMARLMAKSIKEKEVADND